MTEQYEISKVESPCVRNCCLNEEDICLGCFRTLTEVTQWTLVDDETRRQFLDNSIKRRVQHKSSC